MEPSDDSSSSSSSSSSQSVPFSGGGVDQQPSFCPVPQPVDPFFFLSGATGFSQIGNPVPILPFPQLVHPPPSHQLARDIDPQQILSSELDRRTISKVAELMASAKEKENIPYILPDDRHPPCVPTDHPSFPVIDSLLSHSPDLFLRGNGGQREALPLVEPGQEKNFPIQAKTVSPVCFRTVASSQAGASPKANRYPNGCSPGRPGPTSKLREHKPSDSLPVKRALELKERVVDVPPQEESPGVNISFNLPLPTQPEMVIEQSKAQSKAPVASVTPSRKAVRTPKKPPVEAPPVDPRTPLQKKLGQFEEMSQEILESPRECSPKRASLIRNLQKLVAKFSLEGKISSLLWDQGRNFMKALSEAIGLGCTQEVVPNVHSNALPVPFLIASDATLISLYFLADPLTPTTYVIDECISNIVDFLNRSLSKFLFPVYDPSLGSVKDEERPDLFSPAIKKELLVMNIEFAKYCRYLAARRKLSDSHLLRLMTLSLQSIFIEVPPSLQLMFVDVLCEIFRRYPTFRDVILVDLCSSLIKLPTSKRNRRNFKIQEKKSIQLFVTLIMRLIQCCTGLRGHRPNSKVTSSKVEADLDVPIDDEHKSYDVALRVAERFQDLFLKNCFQTKVSKTREAKSSEFRSIFSNFFDDLLECFMLPAWPAAELLLNIGITKLMIIIRSSKDHSFRSFSIQLVGKFARKIRKEIKRAADEAKLFSTEDIPESEEDTSCLCKKGYEEGQEMVQCDRCKSWFHFGCVGVDDKIASRVWCCENCVLFGLISDCKSALQLPDKPEGEVDEYWNEEESIFVAQQVLHQFLLERSMKDLSVDDARCFCLSRWNQDASEMYRVLQQQSEEIGEEQSPVCKILDFELKIYPAKWLLKNCDYAEASSKLSPDDALKVARFLFCRRPVMRENFDIYVSFLTSYLGDDQVAIRRDALKGLCMVIEVDPDFLGEESIKAAVAACLRDTAKAVRKQAVDLVGEFVSLRPTLAPHYIDIIVERSRDIGVSVRKSAVGILHNICVSDPENFGTQICVCLVKRMEDIKPIKKKVFDTFQSVWFRDLPSDSSSSGCLSLPSRVRLIAEVVMSCHNYDWLVKLFRTQIQTATPKEQVRILGLCKDICEALVSSFISSMEETFDLAEKKQNMQYSIAYVTCLELFSQVNPSLLLLHVEALSTYLKPASYNDPEAARILCKVCLILERCVPQIVNPSPETIVELERDLNTIIYRVESTLAIRSAIRCLSVIVSSVSHHSEVLRVLFDEFAICFLNFVRSKGWKPPGNFQCQINPNPAQEKKAAVTIIRALFSLGMICRYFKVDELDSSEEYPRSEMILSMYLFLFNLKTINESVKSKAMQGFSSLWILKPKIIVDHKDLIHTCLQSKTPELVEETLKGLFELLNEEHARIDGVMDNIKQPDEDDEDDDDLLISNRPSSRNEETDIIGSAIQLHKEDLLRLLLHPRASIRKRALDCIQSIIQQALTHPGDCVPNIVALSGETHPILSAQGKRLVIHLEKHYPDFFWSRFTHCLSSIFSLRKMLADNEEAAAAATSGDQKKKRKIPVVSPGEIKEEGCAHSLLFDLAREKRITLQDRFFAPLIFRFNTDTGAWDDSRFLHFLALLVITLPFRVEEEILHTIYLINQLISLQSNGIQADLEKSLGQKKKQSPEAYARDLVEKGKKAFASILLIEIKKGLRMGYNLDADKCQAYQVFKSSTSTKPCDRADLTQYNLQIEGLSKYLPVLVSLPQDSDDLRHLEKVCTEMSTFLNTQLEQDDDDFNEETLHLNKKKSRKGGSRSSSSTKLETQSKKKRSTRVAKPASSRGAMPSPLEEDGQEAQSKTAPSRKRGRSNRSRYRVTSEDDEDEDMDEEADADDGDEDYLGGGAIKQPKKIRKVLK